MEQRTLQIGDRIIYSYEDGSVEYFSSSTRNAKNPLVRTFGSKRGDGYRFINIKLNGKQRSLAVHRLIATVFHSNPSNLPEVDHINKNRSDNRPSNLRWVTSKENQSNKVSVENCIAKYGVRRCTDRQKYDELYSKDYRSSHVTLRAKQPSGKQTKYCFSSTSDPTYIALKHLSQKYRYVKYQELKCNTYNSSIKTR